MSTTIKSKQLEILLNDFELISKTVLIQLQITSKLLENSSLDMLYEEAEENEMIIDRMEMKIREEVVFTIFTFNPLAADLRRIIAYQDITTNLERVGDVLLNIIHFLREFDQESSPVKDFMKDFHKMIAKVQEMIVNSLVSFTTKNTALAYQTIKDDKEVNKIFHKINTSLQEEFSEKLLHRENIHSILCISLINQNLERVGDSATNIAEATVYLIDGKDIRHKIK